jgi:hypothetical protein
MVLFINSGFLNYVILSISVISLGRTESGYVPLARMSQIMSLLNLAPDIQEAILFLPKTVTGRDCVSSREVIGLAGTMDFYEQRRRWKLFEHGRA